MVELYHPATGIKLFEIDPMDPNQLIDPKSPEIHYGSQKQCLMDPKNRNQLMRPNTAPKTRYNRQAYLPIKSGKIIDPDTKLKTLPRPSIHSSAPAS